MFIEYFWGSCCVGVFRLQICAVALHGQPRGEEQVLTLVRQVHDGGEIFAPGLYLRC